MGLGSGHKHECFELFELENEFLSVSLLIYDVFVWKKNKFLKRLFCDSEDSDFGYFEFLIGTICRIGVVKERKESVLPLLVVVLRAINKTSNKKLNKFTKNGIKKHVNNLIRIANDCQQFEHAWNDDIAMDLIQLKK